MRREHYLQSRAPVLCVAYFFSTICRAQFFPQEIVSTTTPEQFCAKPTTLNGTDINFELTQYTRIPFTSSPHLEDAHTADPQGFGKHKDLLHRIYGQPLLLTRSQVERSVSSPGEEERVQRFVNKLLAGEAVTVVTLGGSISYGHGVATFNNSWVSRLYHYISDTFPNPRHQLLNHAIPATTSSFVAPCAYTMVPENVDLILVEFTLNDMADEMSRRLLDFRKTKTLICHNDIDSPGRRSMERLLRQLLSLPSKPAVIYVHAWAGNRPFKFYEGVEDYYTTIMSYYGVTALSFRNAMYHAIKGNETILHKIWPVDSNFHPNCVGTRFMADMVVGYLMDRLATGAWLKHAKHVHSVRALPPALAEHLMNPGQGPAALPPPLFDGNWGNYSTDCVLDDRIQSYVSHNLGFTWVNEGLPSDPKWGFVSQTPGAQLAMKIPLSNISYNGQDLVVGVGLLLSYKDMGIAQLGCLTGCACVLKEYSTYVKYSGWSMTYWRFLQVKVMDGSSECVVGVINAQRTHSTGHKIKVCSLLVSGEMSSADAGNAWLEAGLVDDNNPTVPAMVHRRRAAEQLDVGERFRTGSVEHNNDLLSGASAVDLFPRPQVF